MMDLLVYDGFSVLIQPCWVEIGVVVYNMQAVLKGVLACDVASTVDNGVPSLFLDGDPDSNVANAYLFTPEN